MEMEIDLGHSKLIWHNTNKQMAFEFMADHVMLTHEEEVKRQNLDPFFLRQLLGREPTAEEKVIEIKYTTSSVLDCSFMNPDYGAHIAKRFIKRLKNNCQPQRLLLVPNYGLATKKESMLFWRALPFLVSHKQILFHLLPNDEGERVRRGM